LTPLISSAGNDTGICQQRRARQAFSSTEGLPGQMAPPKRPAPSQGTNRIDHHADNDQYPSQVRADIHGWHQSSTQTQRKTFRSGMA
jgi:hypothetical protein